MRWGSGEAAGKQHASNIAPGFSLGEELGVGIFVFPMCFIWFPKRERLRLFNIGNL
jgi:hypothetical protein